MKIAGIVLICIGVLGAIGLLMDGDIYRALVGGGIITAAGIAMITKGKSHKE